jgi:hypothetical protein
MDHDLHHHRFSQGKTVKRHPKKKGIQQWRAWELEGASRRAYTLEREPHVVNEKEPDNQLQSKVTEASLPLEIKVAESSHTERLFQAPPFDAERSASPKLRCFLMDSRSDIVMRSRLHGS